MLQRLVHLDRRVIYVLVLLSVLVPLWLPLNLPITPTAPTVAAFEAVEKLPEGSLILMSADYGASTKVEIHPVVMATFYQAMKQNKKVVFMALTPEGQSFASQAIAAVEKAFPQKKYGQDFVNLGYKAGNEAPLVSMGIDFRGVFPTDVKGTPLSDIPMLSRVTRLSQFDLVGTYSYGTPGALEHIRTTATQYGRPLVVVTTAVMTPQYFPYMDSKQIVGLVGGLRGAAEYEKLTGVQTGAIKGMDAQSLAHFTIAGLIVFSNLMSLLLWWQKRKSGRS